MISRLFRGALSSWALLFFFAPILLQANTINLQSQANVPIEITFSAAHRHTDPFNEVTLDAVFLDPLGRELIVPAFWAGGNVWKARYASSSLGLHSFHTECSDKTDKGLNGISGKVTIKPFTGSNALYMHGPLQLTPNRRFLQHTDGTPFFWLGDTWWMGLCSRLHWPDEFKTLTADRKEKGFNVIQIVAGLYPDMNPFDPRGANETGFPWTTNYGSIRPEYFNAADERLGYLVEQGFTPCIFGAWGHYISEMGIDKMKQHWRYLIARYAAWPVVFCAAGEANLPWYQVQGFPYDDRKQAKDWSDVMRYIRATDPFHRLLTVHPTGIHRLSSRNVTDDPGLLDIDALQTPHGLRDAVADTVKNVRQSYADNPRMPVINTEASYEQLVTPKDVISTEWTRRMFWLCMMNGAAGHTYGANGIWQCNRRGQPHGPSPNAGSPAEGYGVIPWDEAMALPGSKEEGQAKKFLMQFDWQHFRPHPEWAEFVVKSDLSFDGCQWIWYPEGNPASNAPAAERWFRRTFVLPDKAIKSAQLRISADDRFTAHLNDKVLGSADVWKLGRQFNDLGPILQPGTNLIAILAENKPAPKANPAGLIARLEIRFADGEELRILTDESWRCASNAVPNWDSVSYNDNGWSNSMVLGKAGDSPWGKFDPINNDDVYAPQSVGIPGVVKIIYVPQPDTIVIRNLGAEAAYTACTFDPVLGETGPSRSIVADTNGLWTCAAPSGCDHDWVLVLRNSSQNSPDPRIVSNSARGPAADPARDEAGHSLTLTNDKISWGFDWSDQTLRSTHFQNKRSGHSFCLSQVQELSLTFSASPNQIEQPLRYVSDFQVVKVENNSPTHARFQLRSPSNEISATLDFQLDGSTRRKWVEVKNASEHDMLLLDIDLDDFTSDGLATGGGEGQPVYVEGEVFAAIEHPAGVNQADKGRVRLSHYPGKRLAPGEVYRSHTALVSVAEPEKAQEHFVSYIQEKSLRPKKALSVYTPLGINNLWGGCPTLDDEQTLNVLNVIEKWQKKGMRFDYFTLDTGWVDPASDLTKFRPTCYPNGPDKIVQRVKDLNMKFGLWFATAWGAQSAWDYPPAYANDIPQGLPWREGYPTTREGITFCLGEERYHQLLKNAVLYHVRHNNVRLLKFDGGDYICDRPDHGHLPGKYSVEARFANLIDIAEAARAAAPDVFIMWYWGLRSPFWALYGDLLFESGLHMEGSATSRFPALYYRDSVNVAQDQNAQFARNVPPVIKDSLGVWIADDRWGNFMGKERWREALVMDIGRGNLFAPNLWGDIYLFDNKDVDFLARMTKFTRENQSLLQHRKIIAGDPMRNEVYGYACGDGRHALVFLNNNYFLSRPAELRLDSRIGLSTKAGSRLSIISQFPEQNRLRRPDGQSYRAGDVLQLALRPFEIVMLEIKPGSLADRSLAVRSVSRSSAADLGTALALKTAKLDPLMDIRFADAGNFEAQKFKRKTYAFETPLPSLDGPQPILAVSIRLKKDGAEWKYKPTVVQIVQARARIADENVQMIPVPDSRQYGNTQADGCSWVVYKLRLSRQWSGKPLKLAVHAYLPDGVEAEIESFVVKRWWDEDTRPQSDGYYTDEPS